MARERFVGMQPRLAVVTSVDHSTGVAQTRWVDDDETGPSIPVPHPFSGRGEGIFVGLRQGSLVMLIRASYGRYVPVAVVPMRGLFASDLSDIPEMYFDDVGVPMIDDGEIVVQGPTGARFRLDAGGSLGLYNNSDEGWRIGGDPDDAHRCAIMRFPPVAYTVSQAGFEACGIVRRDIRPNDESLDAAIFDPLLDLGAEQLLEEVGRDPTHDVTHGTRRSSTGDQTAAAATFRNPPFIERRGVLYEFGTGWNVGTRQDEEDLLKGRGLPVRIPSDRREHRSNVLSLSLLYPNELMESVDGTLVDIFGNLLDINRSVIQPPSGGEPAALLESMLENARHTVVLHREINTRKGWVYLGYGIPNLVEIPDVSDASGNAGDRSRWFVDVDKEGLTKINIPATSETGNVPCLVRHETSSAVKVDDNGGGQPDGRSEGDARRLFRNDLEAGQQRQDVFLDQFGPGGIAVRHVQSRSSRAADLSPDNRLSGEPTSYVEGSWASLPAKVQGGTAFHSITQTAAKLLAASMNQLSYETVDREAQPPERDGAALNSEVIQSFLASVGEAVQLDDAGRPTNYPNAGGRSLHANLDGSVELSVGANTIDRLSWVMDTAGGIVARLGRDRYGRSAILHLDGSLAMEVGGYDFVGPSSDKAPDRRFSDRPATLKRDPNVFRAGKIVIRVRRANRAGSGPDQDGDNLDQVLIVDENGISIQATGQLSLKSTMDLVLQSDGQIVLDSKVLTIGTGDHKRMVLKQGARKQI